MTFPARGHGKLGDEAGQVVRLRDSGLRNPSERRGPRALENQAPVAKDAGAFLSASAVQTEVRYRIPCQRGCGSAAVSAQARWRNPGASVPPQDPELLGLLANDGGATRQLEKIGDLAPERVGVDSVFEEIHGALP